MWVGMGRTHEEFWSISPFQYQLTVDGWVEIEEMKAGSSKRKSRGRQRQPSTGPRSTRKGTVKDFLALGLPVSRKPRPDPTEPPPPGVQG